MNIYLLILAFPTAEDWNLSLWDEEGEIWTPSEQQIQIIPSLFGNGQEMMCKTGFLQYMLNLNRLSMEQASGSQTFSATPSFCREKYF